MRAYEFSTKIAPDGKLELPDHLKNRQVRVIVLVEELPDSQAEDEDDTSVEEIATSLLRALHEVKTGQTKPIAQLWDSLDDD
ncbi:hypothetical protein C7B82_10970 [Stenomitos frigidus ULC18]|uniref:Uncharacterized protein n=1 Tax=Stenomitos frigidus ULC18 TaxID=2107698 RepID=A0A2T1E9W4_9CYAN|nr:hypothetical protein C7B82_10970 [Stenomitos frigidus ULC18]